MYNFMAAFVLCGLVVIIGEVVSRITRAWVPSVFVSAVILLAGYWTVIPKELVTDSKLIPFGATVGMFIVITHMGTVISLKALLSQWKTVVLCVTGLAGMCAGCWCLGPLFMEKTLIIAGLPPLTGGIVAATMMQNAAQNAGLTTAAVFAISMYCIQGFAGYPLTAICLKRESDALIREFRSGAAGMSSAADLQAVADVTKLPEERHGILTIPERWNSPILILTKLGIVAWAAMLMGSWTGISGAIWALVLGVIFNTLGFLDTNALNKANSYQITVFALMMFIFDGLKDCTPEMLIQIAFPMVMLIVTGLLGMAVAGWAACKVLRVSPWLGFSNCLTALYGFPFNAIITESLCEEVGKTKEEREFLMSRLFPSMIVGGFTTVTITSVVIAGIFSKML